MLRKTTESFIKEANKIHNNLYLYDDFIYSGSTKKGTITCKKHGNFEQVVSEHLRGRGCPKCFGTFKKTNEEFIEECKKQHSDLYNYSKVDYKGYHKKVIIGCKIHGDFEQRAFAHIKGHGCPKCFGTFNKTNEKFLEESKKIHGDKFDYSKTFYENRRKEVTITCRKHGDFKQLPPNHLKGNGCPICNRRVSIPEIELQTFVRSLNFEVETNTMKIISNLELDVFLPELNKAIEFNGMWWHYDKKNKYGKSKGYHAMKAKAFKEKGVRILFLREDLWKTKKEKMKNIILKFLNG